MKMSLSYVVKYPPDYDGELHIFAASKDVMGIQVTKVEFEIARKSGETVQEAIVRAAQDIVRQNKRS